MLTAFLWLLGFGAVTGVALAVVYATAGCGGLDCGANGQCVGGLASAAPHCACADGYGGTFCEYPPIDLSTVPAQCVAGMGSHGVVYNGTAYRTLDDAPPEGGYYGAPNGGCQRYYDDGPQPNYLPLPPGYALAPPDADTIAVIAAHGWGTECAVTADGAAWYSGNWGPGNRERAGDRFGSNRLVSSGGSHTVRSCPYRVLARCP